MGRKAYAVVDFPDQRKVAASVATTASMVVLTLGDGREEHYTYPKDGRFHVTSDGSPSIHSFFARGPAFPDIDYRRFALVPIPVEASALIRLYSSTATPAMIIPPPTEREGLLEVGLLGCKASAELLNSLSSQGASLALVRGPNSNTTIVLRYTL